MTSHNIKVLHTREEILSRIIELSQNIYQSIGREEWVWLMILKGAFAFGSELFLHMPEDITHQISFIQLKSYTGTVSSGEVSLIGEIPLEVQGKNCLIIEDIVDTGHTITFLHKHLREKMQVKDIKVATLLNKAARREVEVSVDWVGFEIENHFVVGYGLDYNEGYLRHLPYIGYIS